jgi:alanine racemase
MASPIPLKPVMTLKSQVVALRTLPAGSSIGYGRTFTLRAPTRAALVPAGYGDGYRRLLSNRTQVLIRGQRAPVRGRVSMDQVVVDVSSIPAVQLYDEVVLFGVQQVGSEQVELPVQEVSSWAETIPNEMLCGISSRVTRLYRRGGRIVSAKHFDEMDDHHAAVG